MAVATWPMMRGHVWNIWFNPDDPTKTTPITKYVVIVQGQHHFRNKRRVSAVLTTSQPEPRDLPWEVRVPANYLPFWDRDTRICCSDIWSFLVEELHRFAGQPVGVLPDSVMHQVEVALAISLGLVPLP